MKKTLSFILMSMLILVLAGYGAQGPGASKARAMQGPEQSAPSSDSKTLPGSYPKEVLPLVADAEILDVRENPANKGLEVIYVTDNDMDMLCDYYKRALKDGKNFSITEMPGGHMITGKLDDLDYSIMLSKDAMKSNPKYSGKISVYIILTGLEGVSSGGSQFSKSNAEEWPSADLPGVPQLKGHIDQILREDGIIRLWVTVENAESVKSYIGKLTASGFSFDIPPNMDSENMEFLAFKDNSMMSFAYKGEENLVSIQYQN
jgi:hypothetical protein